jgi:septal ring factor EnvC (AmiA/AmiB activator)
MKIKKEKKFLKEAKKLSKKIKKHGQDGERLLKEIQKLFEASSVKMPKKTASKAAVKKTTSAVPKTAAKKTTTTPQVSAPPEGNSLGSESTTQP